MSKNPKKIAEARRQAAAQQPPGFGAQRSPSGAMQGTIGGAPPYARVSDTGSLRVELNDEQMEQVIEKVFERLKEVLLEIKKDNK